jgi:hypothetical protein
MDRDDHERTPRRGRGRPRKQALAPDGLEAVRRQIALEVVAELLEEWGGERLSAEALVRLLLARAREEG